MKLNELVNVLYNIKVNVLLDNEDGVNSIYNALVEGLKSDNNLKKYEVDYVLQNIEKDLTIVVKER